MEPHCTNRREFLLKVGGAAGAALIQAHWPQIVAAAEHAHQAANATHPTTFEVFTPVQGKEVAAICARIIPTDDTPGATEAGAVYFIDQALKGFASDTKPVYDKGLVEVAALTKELYPGVERFSGATPEQQDRILTEYAGNKKSAEGRFGRTELGGPNFFETITFHTTFGYLVDPSGGGNRDYVGWKAIGRDPEPGFMPPFGFYDKDYPGWQPAPSETNKA